LFWNDTKSKLDDVWAEMRAHGSSTDSFNCHARYLVAECNAIQINPRDFCMNGGEGPIRTLTKKSRFGGVLRPGKSAGEGGPTNRHNAQSGGGSRRANRSGIIASY